MNIIEKNKGKGSNSGGYKHGMAYMKEYYVFNTMRAKCYNPKDHAYKNYGARGIGICDEWLNNPKLFIDYVKLLPNYGIPTYSIDRINNDGNYEPGNLRWASKSTQVRNSRTFKGGNSRKKRINPFSPYRMTTSGYYGIAWNKTWNGWDVRLPLNGKTTYVGSSKDIEIALNKRNAFMEKHNIENRDKYFIKKI